MNLLSITYLGISSEAIVMLVVTIVLLCLSALMSGSEAALFSLTHREKQQMEESGDSRDHTILAQLANVDRLLATILIANNLVNICVVITSSRFIDMIMQTESLTIEFIIKSVVVTFLLLLFGEILPKVFSQSRPYSFSRMVIYPIKVVSAIVYPIHPTYDSDLWILAVDRASGAVAGCGIGEFDEEAGEGVLEWIQVLPAYRGRGIGRLIVNQLLSRMRFRAKFATVSGQIRNRTKPERLYRKCGFSGEDVWHILRRR